MSIWVDVPSGFRAVRSEVARCQSDSAVNAAAGPDEMERDLLADPVGQLRAGWERTALRLSGVIVQEGKGSSVEVIDVLIDRGMGTVFEDHHLGIGDPGLEWLGESGGGQ